jgi:putative endonuclease
MKKGYVYIITNYSKTVLYIGVTSNLAGRILQHKNNEGCEFSKKYSCKYLVYYEEFEGMREAIEQEKRLKKWHRDWKFNLIKTTNPELKDLSAEFWEK